jgi:hypothetical protein
MEACPPTSMVQCLGNAVISAVVRAAVPEASLVVGAQDLRSLKPSGIAHWHPVVVDFDRVRVRKVARPSLAAALRGIAPR